MADQSSLEKTFRQRELDKIKEIAEDIEKEEIRQRKLREKWQWKGNKLPPFSIEPFAKERQRLGGTGMTAADRALRKQWLEDQILAPHEPVAIPDLRPRNPIRRFFAMPMQALQAALTPAVGKQAALTTRWWVGKLAGAMLVVYSSWYHLKYHPLMWETVNGWHSVHVKQRILPGEPGWEKDEKPMAHDDFFDLQFKSRKALLDTSETSFTRPAYYPPKTTVLFGHKFFCEEKEEGEEVE